MKPENFVIGSKNNSKLLYIIDYGLARLYRDPKTYMHIPPRDNKRFLGTARYASLYTHLGIEQSRRDDMESLGYIFVYLLKSKLPWQGVKVENSHQRHNIIKEKKQEITVEELCTDLPIQFLSYMRYCKKLKFEEKPNYTQLKIMFKNLFYEKHYDRNFGYDWFFLDALNKIEVPMNNNTNGTNQASISGTNLQDNGERGYHKLIPKCLDTSTNKFTLQPENSKAILDTDIKNSMGKIKRTGGKTAEINTGECFFLSEVLYKKKNGEVIDSSSCNFKESEIIEHERTISNT